jgi:hypothetical protein
MKTCFLGTGGYVGKVAARGWPAPPELCEREEAMRSMDTAIRQYKLAEEPASTGCRSPSTTISRA